MHTSIQTAGGLMPPRSRHARPARATLRRLRAFLRRTMAQWNRHRRAAAVHAALRDLDAHTLRDLGFHPSELMSVAAEVAGVAEQSRVRVVRSTHGGNA